MALPGAPIGAPKIDRSLAPGLHPYAKLMPKILDAPAMRRIYPRSEGRAPFVERARVRLVEEEGFCWIDESAPCIVLAHGYYRSGALRDLHLDLLHELTHLRQLEEGHDVWDERYAYVDRPTEIEGYAVAVEEGRRLGMSDAELRHHLSNPWMTDEDVTQLIGHIARFLGAR